MSRGIEAELSHPARQARSVAGLFLAAFLLLGCAAAEREPPSAFQLMTEDMFTTVLRDIRDTYIEEEDLFALTLAGLEGATEIDPALSVVQSGEEVTILSNGAAVASVTVLPDEGVAGFAKPAAQLLSDARAGSGSLREASDEQIYDSVFSSMVGTLDRYSRYAGSDDARSNRESREGFGGIGITIGEHPQGARVLTVLDNNPGQAAGVHVGDIIVSIDDRAIAGLPLRRILRLLRGPVDQPVSLVLRRPGLEEPLAVTAGRTRIIPDTVFLTPSETVATIRITAFNDRTAKRVAEAVAEAREIADDGLQGLVLDLRGNPGGLLDKAIDVADLFLHDGVISLTDGRHPRSFQKFSAESGDVSAGLPLAILVDGASASAAEVLAAALQDRGRAVVIGASTFGKGSVQTVLALPNGGELILTWARLLAPSGYVLQDGGIMPTICTQGSVAADQLLRHALVDDPATTLHNLSLRRRIQPDNAAARDHLASLCPWRVGEDGGVSEAAARLLLTDPDLYENAIAVAIPSSG